MERKEKKFFKKSWEWEWKFFVLNVILKERISALLEIFRKMPATEGRV